MVLPFAGRMWPLSWSLFCLHWFLLEQVIAIGDSANPVLSIPLGIAVDILGFPMFWLPDSVFDSLKPHLTDNGVIELFVAINAVFWAFVASRLIGLNGLAGIVVQVRTRAESISRIGVWE